MHILVNQTISHMAVTTWKLSTIETKLDLRKTKKLLLL